MSNKMGLAQKNLDFRQTANTLAVRTHPQRCTGYSQNSEALGPKLNKTGHFVLSDSPHSTGHDLTSD